MKKEKTKVENKFNFWPYFAKQKGLITVYLLTLIIDIGFMTFNSIYGAKVMVDIAGGLYRQAIRRTLILTGVILMANVVSLFRNFAYYKLSNKIINSMCVDIGTQAFKIADQSYSEHQTGEFLTRISSDPSKIFNAMHGFVNHVQSIITSLIIIGYITFISHTIGLIVICSVLIVLIIEKTRKRIYKKNHLDYRKKSEQTSSLLNEVIRSQKDIKSLNLEQTLRNNLINLTEVESKQGIKTSVTNRLFWFVKIFIVNILLTVIVVVGLIQTDLGLLTLGSFMIIYNNKRDVNSLSNILSDVFGYFAEIELAVMNISQLYQDDEFKLEKFGNKKLKNVKGCIEFKNVEFSYPEYRKKTDDEIKEELKNIKKNNKQKIETRVLVGKKLIFDNLNFKVEPNTSVAFVGKSGAGKTTILNLMSKMYDVDKGQILIDNVNINKLDKETIRNSISLVNQFPYIFDMSIKDNLLLANNLATDEDINQVIKNCALESFIKELPNGLDTRVGESGIKLSGGQKQRLAIARAMLRKSPIIIFDESTSSLDNLAQSQVKESIDSIKGKSTVVIVAHRLSTIKNVDKIFFIDNGEIVDSGTFEQLYKTNKTFKTMFLAENL